MRLLIRHHPRRMSSGYDTADLRVMRKRRDLAGVKFEFKESRVTRVRQKRQRAVCTGLAASKNDVLVELQRLDLKNTPAGFRNNPSWVPQQSLGP